jgi:low affinity Fe/Cu permease
MSLLRTYSKYIPGVLLILLFVLILLVFKSFHNALISSGITLSPGWAIFFLVLIAIIGILNFMIIQNTNNQAKILMHEIDTLKNRIEESKLQKEMKKETVVKEKIDIEKETKSIIPSNNEALEKFGEALLLNICKRFNAVQGLFYLKNPESGIFSFKSGYAYFSETEPISYKEGETLAGQVAKNKKVLNLSKIPDSYITIMSGLGDGFPNYLLIVPIISPNNETIGIIEIASFKSFSSEVEELFAYLGHKLGEKLVQPSKS